MTVADNALTLITFWLFTPEKLIVKHQALEQSPVVPREVWKVKYLFHFYLSVIFGIISCTEDELNAKLYQS